MLDSMQRFAKHAVIKLLLLGLIATFVVWGVGDVLRNSGSNAVATVGDSEVSQAEFASALRFQIQRFQAAFGEALDEEKIAEFGLREMAVGQLINDRLIAMRLSDLGIAVDDEAVGEQIRNNAIFANEEGLFSRDIFLSVLRSNGLSESQYVRLVFNDINKRLLLDTLVAAVPPLDVFEEWAYAHQAQKRVIDYVTVAQDIVNDIGEPTDTDLRQFYQENERNYTVEEMREAAFVRFSIDDVSGDVEVSEEAMREHYEQNLYVYANPEKRRLEQYLFNNEDEAKVAYEALVNGKQLEQAAVPMGFVSNDGLPESVRDSVFSLNVGKYSKPLSSGLGWHIFVVKEVQVANTTPFEAALSDIEQALRQERVLEDFEVFITHIEDDLASGLRLEELSEKYGFEVKKTVAFNARGFDAKADSLTEADVPDPQNFIATTFASDVGVESSLMLLPDNQSYMIVRVEHVYPSRVKALDEVRGVVMTQWKDRERAKLQKVEADKLLQKAREAGSLKDIAGKYVQYHSGIKVSRPDSGSIMQEVSKDTVLPTALLYDLYTMPKGEVSPLYRSTDGNLVAASVREIIVDDLTEEEANVLRSEIADNLNASFSNDIAQQYYVYLRDLYPVDVNETLLKSVR